MSSFDKYLLPHTLGKPNVTKILRRMITLQNIVDVAISMEQKSFIKHDIMMPLRVKIMAAISLLPQHILEMKNDVYLVMFPTSSSIPYHRIN